MASISSSSSNSRFDYNDDFSSDSVENPISPQVLLSMREEESHEQKRPSGFRDVSNSQVDLFNDIQEDMALMPGALNPIVDKLKQQIIFSPNYPNRDSKLESYLISKGFSKQSKNYQEKYSKFVLRQLKNLQNYRDLKEIYINSQPKAKLNPLIFNSINSKILRRLDFGNCYEMSFRAFSKLTKKPFGRVEVVELKGKGADHVFVIVNRPPNSDINNPETCGPECYVVDIWSGGINIFPAQEIPLHLGNYEGLDRNTLHAMIGKFNPQQHHIRLVTSSLWSVDDLNYELAMADFDVSFDRDGDAVAQILVLLDLFIKSEEVSIKRDIAQQIVGYKISNPIIKHTISVLRTQMKLYLDPSLTKVFFIGPEKPYATFGNDEIKADFFEDILTAVMVDELVKIAELFKHGEIKKAGRRLVKINPQVKGWILKKFMNTKPVHNDQSSSKGKAEAIYSWIFEQIAKAQKNKRFKEVEQILSRLPAEQQEIFTQMIPLLTKSGKLESLMVALKSGWLKNPFGRDHAENRKYSFS